MSKFTNQEKADEVRREVGYRQRVYARLVSEGKMHYTEQQRRIGIMQAILDDYQKLDAADRPDLFGGQ